MAWSPDEEAAEEKSKSSPMKYVLIGGAVLFLLCGGIAAISGGIWFFTQPDADRGDPIVHASEDEDPHERDKTPEIADTGSNVDQKPTALETTRTPDPEPEPEPKAPTQTGTSRSGSTGSTGSTSGSTRSTGSSSSGSTRSGSTSSSGSTRSGSTTTSGSTTGGSQTSSSGSSSGTATVDPTPVVLPGSAYEVKISLPSKKKATIRCGDGQSNKFSSAVRMEFKGTVTCVVEADGARGAISVDRGGRVSCGITGEDIICSGPS